VARLARLSVAGLPHHVVQRSVDRAPLFQDAADCQDWLQGLRSAAQANGLAVHAWVLLPDHAHLLATAPRSGSISRAMQSLSRRFAVRYHRRHGDGGPLWEGRFQCTVLEPEDWLIDCARYIETHPARCGLIDDPTHYRWSSVRHHAGLAADPLISDHPLFWALGNTPFERQSAWQRLLEAPLQEARIEALRHATRRGWALGSAPFIETLAAPPGRLDRLRPRPRGRPRKVLVPEVSR
jgi:putative transposase